MGCRQAGMHEPTCSATDADFLARPELECDAIKSMWCFMTVLEVDPTELQVALLGPAVQPQTQWLPCNIKH